MTRDNGLESVLRSKEAGLCPGGAVESSRAFPCRVGRLNENPSRRNGRKACGLGGRQGGCSTPSCRVRRGVGCLLSVRHAPSQRSAGMLGTASRPLTRPIRRDSDHRICEPCPQAPPATPGLSLLPVSLPTSLRDVTPDAIRFSELKYRAALRLARRDKEAGLASSRARNQDPEIAEFLSLALTLEFNSRRF